MNNNKCICNNLGSPSCINKYCKNCCNGINCNTHNYKTRECDCKIQFFNKYCKNLNKITLITPRGK
jgi:hypothetical protein